MAAPIFLTSGGSRSLAAAAVLAIAACGGDSGTEPTPTETATGSITVAVTTAGIDLDTDGYQVRVSGALRGSIGSDGTLTVSNLPVGSHVVSLDGMARNCAVPGQHPVTASVAEDQTASVAFDVECVADVGTLQVAASTTGRVLDPDGYTITVEDVGAQAIGLDAAVDFALTPGTYAIALTGQAANCVPRGQPEAVASVVFGQTRTVTFELVCFEDPIVFERERASDGQDIWVVEATGGPEVRLTDDPVTLHYSGLTSTGGTAWNPDRTHITFQSAPQSSFTNYDIYVLALNKSEMFRYESDDTELQPKWSPDGTRILFGGFGSGSFSDFFVADAELNDPVNLTNSPSWEMDGQWSPDGTRILFADDPADGAPRASVMVMNADGTGRVNISELVGGHGPGVNDREPRWSPDGSKIAFVRHVEGSGFEGDIWVVDADGSDAVQLTDSPDDREFRLLWSPDGTTIYYALCPMCTVSNGPAVSDVWALAVDGSSNVQVTDTGDEAPGAFNATTTFAGQAQAGTNLVTINGILSVGLQLFVMTPDGTGRAAVTSLEGSANNPHWR